MSELIKRRKGRRILVVTAKSMMVQFQKEMWERFTIPLISLDSSRIQQIRSEISANANPFSYYDKVIISIDTLKRDIQYGAALDALVLGHHRDRRGTECRRQCRQRPQCAARQTRQTPCLPFRHVDHAVRHAAADGRARQFASLMNMLDPTTLPDPERYDKKRRRAPVRPPFQEGRDGRGVGQLPGTQGDVGEMQGHRSRGKRHSII